MFTDEELEQARELVRVAKKLGMQILYDTDDQLVIYTRLKHPDQGPETLGNLVSWSKPRNSPSWSPLDLDDD